MLSLGKVGAMVLVAQVAVILANRVEPVRMLTGLGSR